MTSSADVLKDGKERHVQRRKMNAQTYTARIMAHV